MHATVRKLHPIINGVSRYALAAAAMLVSCAAMADAPPVPDGWKATFVDDFDGPAGAQPSRADWFYNIGKGWPGGPDGWGNNEVQYYTDLASNAGFNGNGELHITAQRDSTGRWTSARLQTHKQTFKAPEGGVLHVEARIKLPAVKDEPALGYWPAFWMLAGADAPGWPSGGEFDIMENVNGLNRTGACCTVAPPPAAHATKPMASLSTKPAQAQAARTISTYMPSSGIEASHPPSFAGTSMASSITVSVRTCFQPPPGPTCKTMVGSPSS